MLMWMQEYDIIALQSEQTRQQTRQVARCNGGPLGERRDGEPDRQDARRRGGHLPPPRCKNEIIEVRLAASEEVAEWEKSSPDLCRQYRSAPS
jgi:hypothetical protein